MREARNSNNLFNGTRQCLRRLLELFSVNRAGMNHEDAARTKQGQT